MTASYQRR